jgi:hypothetical protein
MNKICFYQAARKLIYANFDILLFLRPGEMLITSINTGIPVSIVYIYIYDNHPPQRYYNHFAVQYFGNRIFMLLHGRLLEYFCKRVN